MSLLKYTLLFSLLSLPFGAVAQEEQMARAANRVSEKKSLEFGLGVDVFNISRMNFHSYHSSSKGDVYNLDLRNMMIGGNIYIAREINPWLYADLQGTVGWANSLSAEKPNQYKFYGMGGLGVQFRLTPLFNRKYVEPYFRVGANYLFKDFYLTRSGMLPNFQGDNLKWKHSDEFNSMTDKQKHAFLASFGIGVNSWFNDRIGFGLQADYLTSFTESKLNFPRVLARVMFRIGETKEAPKVIYREKILREIIEKPIEKEVIRYVEKESEPLYMLFANINFEFDKYDITPESAKILDDAAAILKKMSQHKFLITGHTDSRGSERYNEELSRKRANAVVKALEERGVPLDMLKSRGVGRKIAAIPVSKSHIVREGDRKVTIEIIKNMEYWNNLK
ncbi:MAG: OmpA family protein [Porphyromonas sp.]|nr:OmpA family protein [Porphyromonas sp.]